MKVKTIDFIDGSNVKDLSTDALINHINAAKGRIEALEATGVDSSKLNAMIAEDKAFIEDCVKLLDRKS